MKYFYSRPHALTFLDIPEASLQRAVNHGWIVPVRLGSGVASRTEFFLGPDLVAFREKYRIGYYEPSKILERRRLRRGRQASRG